MLNSAVAASPILLAVVLIIGFRRPAGPVALGCAAYAVLLALFWPTFAVPFGMVLTGLAKGSLTSLTVAYVLLGGIALHQVLTATGALDMLADALRQLLPAAGDRLLVMLFGVSVFLESATGFGVGISVTAPLLERFGQPALRAAFLALLGQCAVPWGALGVGTYLGAELSGLPTDEIAAMSALLSWPFVLLCGGIGAYVGGLPGTAATVVRVVVWSVVLTAALAGLSLLLGTELAGCLAGLAVVLLGIARGRRAGPLPAGLAKALTPLAMLLAALLLTRLAPDIGAWTTALMRWDLPALGYALSPVHHPGFWMLVAAATGAAVLGLPAGQAGVMTRTAAARWVLASLPVLGFLAMAQVMLNAGMIDAIAGAMSQSLGPFAMLSVTVLGALGGFLTASNAGSNAIFMPLQMALADQLGLDRLSAAAAQNAAGSNLSFASPGRVVLAAAISGAPEQQHRLMRQALAAGLAGLALLTLGYLATGLWR